MRYLAMAVAALAAVAATAQTDVAEFRPGVTVDGVNYFLPRTRLRIVVEADKAVTVPGEFAPYANRYLRLADAPTVETTEWTISQVSIQALGVPDSAKAYSIRLKGRTSAPLVSLTPDGLLLGVNVAVEPEAEAPLPPHVAAPAPLRGRDFMTQEILSAGSTAKMAQLTAEEIYDIRESRNALVRGEADNTPKDGAQLKLMLDNLDHQLAALEALFKGQTLTSHEVQTIDYEPTAAALADGRIMVGRFSRRLGLVDADDLSGEPLWLTLRPVSPLPAAADDADVARKKQKMEQGLRINMPVRTRFEVATPTQTLVATEVPVAQYGSVEVLSDALFNKHMDTQVEIYQHTGSVRRVSNAADE
ncbi:MAG: DUF4831 family protein [Bacteroidaceae bacterium]|nr:DUF4831 family protein [Bacteroidaceae bacterium]